MRCRQAEDTAMPEPLYEHVANQLRAQVQAGVRKPGERLPTIPALAAEFDVGITTVKLALLILRREGVVRGQPGKATYVA
jgi:DNA-binding GntR family transcriptional regulator